MNHNRLVFFDFLCDNLEFFVKRLYCIVHSTYKLHNVHFKMYNSIKYFSDYHYDIIINEHTIKTSFSLYLIKSLHQMNEIYARNT